MKFAKYEGAGNDFILIDIRKNSFPLEHTLITRLCDRHFGIGADGIMTLGHSSAYDCSMRYYNADGSAGEMCGNGGRCFALFALHLGLSNTTLCFEAPDGAHTARILSSNRFSGIVELGMIDVTEIKIGDGWWFLNTGVPHYVEFTDRLDQTDVANRGGAIRRDTTRFPQGTNVNFAEITGEGTLRVRTYERGVEAETLACGTGATAVALVTNAVFQPDIQSFDVEVPGGKLQIAFERDEFIYRNIRLSGDARKVFEGVIDTENI